MTKYSRRHLLAVAGASLFAGCSGTESTRTESTELKKPPSTASDTVESIDIEILDDWEYKKTVNRQNVRGSEHGMRAVLDINTTEDGELVICLAARAPVLQYEFNVSEMSFDKTPDGTAYEISVDAETNKIEDGSGEVDIPEESELLWEYIHLKDTKKVDVSQIVANIEDAYGGDFTMDWTGIQVY